MQEQGNRDESISLSVVDEPNNSTKDHNIQLSYRLSPAIIVRDECRFFNAGIYLTANPSRLSAWCFSEDIYWLLDFLLAPRSLAEIEEMRECLAASGRVVNPGEVIGLLQSMQQMGIIETVSPDAGEAPSICRSQVSTSSRYVPASSPLSISVELPIEPTLLSRLLQECDDLGILGIDFHGGRDTLHSLSTSINDRSISLGRAASSIRIRLNEVSQETFTDLCNVMRAWGRPPFVILECDGAPDKLRETQLQCFPFCITYQVEESDDVAVLNRVVDAGLSGGAKFVLFDLSDDHIGIGTVQPLEMAALKMEILQSIQKAHPPMKVQIRVRGLPLPKHILAADLTVKQILGQILGGCSAGLFLGNTRSASCDHIASPDELATIGPVLPPNCCQAGMTHMAIDKNGTVYPCEQAVGDPDMAIGSINASSLRDIWNSEKWAFYRGGWDLCDLEGCYRCSSYIACGVRRCRVRAARTSGDTHSPMSACLKSKSELGISIVSGKKAI